MNNDVSYSPGCSENAVGVDDWKACSLMRSRCSIASVAATRMLAKRWFAGTADGCWPWPIDS